MFIKSHARRELAKDLFFVVLGAFIAYLLGKVGAIDALISLLGNTYVASFVAGLFFTSVFTVAPAAVALSHIAVVNPSPAIALWGALGAMFGDVALFFFIRDRFADDLMASLKPSFAKHIMASFHLGFMKWLGPLVGALIIASPLPDEFGLTLLGISKTRLVVLMPIAFLMNLIAVYSLIWFAHIV